MTTNEKTYADYCTELALISDNRRAIRRAKRIRKIADNIPSSCNVDLWDTIIAIGEEVNLDGCAGLTPLEAGCLQIVAVKATAFAIETVVCCPDVIAEDTPEDIAEKMRELCRSLSVDESYEDRARKIIEESEDAPLSNELTLLSVYLFLKAQDAAFSIDLHCMEILSFLSNAEKPQVLNNDEVDNAVKILNKKANALEKAVNETKGILPEDIRRSLLDLARIYPLSAECAEIAQNITDGLYS